MFKTFTVYSLREGTNPGEFLKYHMNVHAKDAVNMADGKMEKYVVNQGSAIIDGKKTCRGLVEIWWKSKSAHDEYIEKGKTYLTSSGVTPGEDFGAHGGVFEFKVFVDETEISIE